MSEALVHELALMLAAKVAVPYGEVLSDTHPSDALCNVRI